MDVGAMQPLSLDERFTAQLSAAASHLKQCEPEKKLLIAVLKDAILDYKKYRWSGNPRFKEAENWIFGDDIDRLFAFETVCVMLGLSAERIRKDLLTADVSCDSTKRYRSESTARSVGSASRACRFSRPQTCVRRGQ
jgi:hypothetical protein